MKLKRRNLIPPRKPCKNMRRSSKSGRKSTTLTMKISRGPKNRKTNPGHLLQKAKRPKVTRNQKRRKSLLPRKEATANQLRIKEKAEEKKNLPVPPRTKRASPKTSDNLSPYLVSSLNFFNS